MEETPTVLLLEHNFPRLFITFSVPDATDTKVIRQMKSAKMEFGAVGWA